MTTSLPTLSSHDAALLNELLALNSDVEALAAKLNRPLHKLLAWATKPTIAAYIAALHQFSVHSEQARQRATLDQLCACLKTLDDPAEIRRTAVAIIRGSQSLIGSLQRTSHPQVPLHQPTAPERSSHPKPLRQRGVGVSCDSQVLRDPQCHEPDATTSSASDNSAAAQQKLSRLAPSRWSAGPSDQPRVTARQEIARLPLVPSRHRSNQRRSLVLAAGPPRSRAP